MSGLSYVFGAVLVITIIIGTLGVAIYYDSLPPATDTYGNMPTIVNNNTAIMATNVSATGISVMGGLSLFIAVLVGVGVVAYFVVRPH